MSEILILKSINGRVLTDKLVDSWLDTNEMFVIKKVFSDDRLSVELTFIDDERTEMMSDLLSTCYADCISIARPQTLLPSLNDSSDEERVPSPVHLSSALSTSSKVSCFSQRLAALDKKKPNDNNQKIKLAVGRGRSIDTGLPQTIARDVSDDENASITNSNATSPTPSLMNNSISSLFGRGRGAVLK